MKLQLSPPLPSCLASTKPDNPGSPGKMAVKNERDSHSHYAINSKTSRTDSIEVHKRLVKPSGKQSLALRCATFVEQRIQTMTLTTAYMSTEQHCKTLYYRCTLISQKIKRMQNFSILQYHINSQ